MSQKPGQIINRGGSTWLVRVFLGRDDKGKRQYHNKTVRGNKRDAEKVLAGLLSARNEGTLSIGSENLLIGALLDSLIVDYRINSRSVEWARMATNHLRPMFEKMAVSSIRVKHVNAYIECRMAAGRKASTINNELALLRRAFNIAVNQGCSVRPRSRFKS